MYPVLCTINDEPLLWQPEGPDALGPGEFYINAEHPNDAGVISVKLADGQAIEDFRISTLPFLLKGDESCEGNTIKGIKFKGCSNTGKSGALSFPGAGWEVEDVDVDLVNTIGVELGQGGELVNMKSVCSNSTFRRVVSRRAGQMGMWGQAKECELVDCGHEGSNWKGFDQWWEAGHKFENFTDCVITGWFARDIRGPGLWFDINNSGNKVYAPVLENCLLAGLFLESGSSGNEIFDPVITGIHHEVINPETPWSVRAGILIQGKSNGNTIYNPNISGVEDAVRINNEDARGNSDGNLVRGCTLSDYSNAFRLLGPLLDNGICSD